MIKTLSSVSTPSSSFFNDGVDMDPESSESSRDYIELLKETHPVPPPLPTSRSPNSARWYVRLSSYLFIFVFSASVSILWFKFLLFFGLPHDCDGQFARRITFTGARSCLCRSKARAVFAPFPDAVHHFATFYKYRNPIVIP